ncbi:DeoR/GlpR family DNA-binding transcription regulator [Nocardioides sp. TRM66260-LWL]|uniref:DeoR/GlpR family DNA-binding transcription regulator n=1 Tax=Nocardioides sp. TRM66260-LWL TaxID=2874478 RepID=UPI001CC3A6E5|nr:DeoR/GlpR family DNA-binding transcription regulator [Nocardioides sp. TRM66260-LWL]MBZ5734357.1 DeoR/GlpR family DNA-binding transcription regulator [Nocardioides sp. TRM66260-LWL]
MYAEERQQAIAQQVAERGRLSVVELAQAYDVTTETVRRDLSALERLGLVRRVHGGAVPPHALSTLEAGLTERDRVQVPEKDRIARAALELLPPAGSTVVLDAGSTTARLVAEWPLDVRLTVFTHAVPLIGRLASLPQVDLHLLPGRVRPTTQAAVGADTVEALGRLRADVVLVGTNGLSPEHGLSTPDPEEAAVKRALVRAGRQVVVACDSSKIGQDALVSFAPLDAVDVLVTDAGLRDADRGRIEAAGVEVVIA